MMNLASVWVSLVFGSPEAVFHVTPAIVGLVVSFSSGSSSLGAHGLSGHIQMSRTVKKVDAKAFFAPSFWTAWFILT